jgi:DNA-binding GntR family transcriptional regulator
VTETTLRAAAEMVRVRLSIERTAAAIVACEGVGDGRSALDAIISDMDAAHEAGDLDWCSVLDRAFHVELARAAGMELLCPVIHRCALHMHRFTLGGLEVPRDFFQEAGVGAEHAALLETLLGSDPITAEQAMTDHLARVLQRWAPSLHQAAGPEAFGDRTSDGEQT